MISNVSGLVIQRIEITECGQDLSITSYYGTSIYVLSGALALHNVTDLRMIRSQNTKSLGYGNFDIGVFRNSSIESCLLAKNRGSKDTRHAYSNEVVKNTRTWR